MQLTKKEGRFLLQIMPKTDEEEPRDDCLLLLLLPSKQQRPHQRVSTDLRRALKNLGHGFNVQSFRLVPRGTVGPRHPPQQIAKTDF